MDYKEQGLSDLTNFFKSDPSRVLVLAFEKARFQRRILTDRRFRFVRKQREANIKKSLKRAVGVVICTDHVPGHTFSEKWEECAKDMGVKIIRVRGYQQFARAYNSAFPLLEAGKQAPEAKPKEVQLPSEDVTTPNKATVGPKAIPAGGATEDPKPPPVSKEPTMATLGGDELGAFLLELAEEFGKHGGVLSKYQITGMIRKAGINVFNATKWLRDNKWVEGKKEIGHNVGRYVPMAKLHELAGRPNSSETPPSMSVFDQIAELEQKKCALQAIAAEEIKAQIATNRSKTEDLKKQIRDLDQEHDKLQAKLKEYIMGR